MYGDFHAAHAGILRRPGDSPGQSYENLPAPPSPAALSPISSSYTSPMYSPESVDVPSPLFVKTPARESRFSLKGLTRTLTQKLGKAPEKPQEEELRYMHNRCVSTETVSVNLEFPQRLDSRTPAPEPSYFPVGAMSPFTPTSPLPHESYHAFSSGPSEVEVSRNHPVEPYETPPLVSMVPDDPSTQLGRIHDPQFPYSEESSLAKPYYDDLDSIYPSSSIYTGDGHRKSRYEQSLSSNRNSNLNPFARYSSAGARYVPNDHHSESLCEYNSQKVFHDLADEADPKADTISKLIDDYNPHNAAGTTEETATSESLPVHALSTSSEGPTVDQLEFGRHRSPLQNTDNGFSGRPIVAQSSGSPPCEAPPLAPAFEYGRPPFFSSSPEFSGILSNESAYSYGDTQNLLQIPRSGFLVPPATAQNLVSSSYSQPEVQPLEPSSSYSQAESLSPHTPKEALDQAERLFQDTVDRHQSDNKIPAMWSRRRSGSQLLNKTVANRASTHSGGDRGAAEEQADWETVGGNSRNSKGHESLDSIADYSSSEGTRDSLGLNSDGSLPYWAKQSQSPGRASYYSHPSPLPTEHSHPFKSSPPELKPRSSARIAHGTSSSQLAAKTSDSEATPEAHNSTHYEKALGRGAVDQPYAFAPWADPYAFSDKETQELLASGPNDNIIIDEQPAVQDRQSRVHQRHQNDDTTPTSSSQDKGVFSSSPVGLERQNTFEKVSVVGPKGNLTGTPRGTGMKETGSSVADTSSPGVRLSSSVGRQSFRSDYPGFYASPFPATGSVTRISQPPNRSKSGRRSSETALFPTSKALKQVREASSVAGSRQDLRNSTTFVRSQRRTSRSAVPGQTKLRHMFLAPDARSTTSSQATHITHFMEGGGRPSTSDTNTPLRSSYPSLDMYPAPTRSTIAQKHSPHLLCVERKANPEDEAQRRKLSWRIFAAFCLLPPCIILFRFLGDNIIASMTEGRLGHCTPESKRMSLIAGIAVNVGLVAAIIVPVLVLHALGNA